MIAVHGTAFNKHSLVQQVKAPVGRRARAFRTVSCYSGNAWINIKKRISPFSASLAIIAAFAFFPQSDAQPT